jgi:hypothetical protein
LHYLVEDMQSWPRLALSVAEYDGGRSEKVLAQGSLMIPFKFGFYQLVCPLGRASRTRLEDLYFFILHESPISAKEFTVPAGFVKMNVNVIHRRNGVKSVLAS